MKIDSALKQFVEKYNEDAIKSIESISQDLGLVANRHKLPLFDINSGIDKFNNYMEGYTGYKIKNLDNPEIADHEFICEQLTDKIDSIFEKKEVLYADLPKFVKSYLDGIKGILEKVDEWKVALIEAKVDSKSIRSINEFTDSFIDRLNESFDPAMGMILKASGYTSRKNLSKNKPVELKPVFL